MPVSAEECAVEQRLANDMGWRLGDTVIAQNSKGEAAQFLKNNRFTIVGIANHPDHTSVSIPDTLYVMVQKDAFDMEALDDCFMKAEIVIDKPEGIDRFTKKYEIVNNYLSHGGAIPKNLHMIFSAWKGMEMVNPYNLPEAHVRYRDGSTTARSDAVFCGGNCTECALTDSGCWKLGCGDQVVFNKH